MNQDIIMGRQPVLEALRAGVELEKIWVLQGTHGDFEKSLRKLLKEHPVPVQHVPVNKLNRLVKNKNHQGVIAFQSLIKYQDVNQIVAKKYEDGLAPLIVVLDGVTDVRNLGAIARSAEIFGADAILTPLSNTAIINEVSMKISAGALIHIPVCREKSLGNALQDLKDMGISLYAAHQNAEKNLDQMNFDEPTAIIFGDEGLGVSPHLMKMVDCEFTIPQFGKTESLNVSVAAGIILYHAKRS